MKKFIPLFILLMFINSCSYFSNDKEKEKEEEEKKWKEYKLKEEVDETKKFNYLSEQISVEKNINLDTVQIVLKEYYKGYREYVFNTNLKRLENIEETSQSNNGEPISLLDFIDKMERNHRIERNKLFSITREIELFFKLENLDQLEDMQYEIQEINSKFNTD